MLIVRVTSDNVTNFDLIMTEKIHAMMKNGIGIPKMMRILSGDCATL